MILLQTSKVFQTFLENVAHSYIVCCFHQTVCSFNILGMATTSSTLYVSQYLRSFPLLYFLFFKIYIQCKNLTLSAWIWSKREKVGYWVINTW